MYTQKPNGTDIPLQNLAPLHLQIETDPPDAPPLTGAPCVCGRQSPPLLARLFPLSAVLARSYVTRMRVNVMYWVVGEGGRKVGLAPGWSGDDSRLRPAAVPCRGLVGACVHAADARLRVVGEEGRKVGLASMP